MDTQIEKGPGRGKALPGGYEPFELYDPSAEDWFSFRTLDEIVAKASDLNVSTFTVHMGGGQQTRVNQIDGQWIPEDGKTLEDLENDNPENLRLMGEKEARKAIEMASMLSDASQAVGTTAAPVQADTFDVVVGDKTTRFESAKEAGAAFFEADAASNPWVIHGTPAGPGTGPGGSARIMACTEIHGEMGYENGDPRYSKALPDSENQIDNDFRAGYAEAADRSLKELREEAEVEAAGLENSPENAIVRAAAMASTDAPAAVIADAPARPYSRPAKLLGGKFIGNEKGEYRRFGEKNIALIDSAEKIKFKDRKLDTFQAGAELAKAKGWQAIEVTGAERFRREAWFFAKLQGLDVVGFTPNTKDIERLELAEKGRGGKASDGAARMANRFAAEKEVARRAGRVHKDELGEGRCIGPVVFQNDNYAVQNIGRAVYRIHDKDHLDNVQRLGGTQVVEIKYERGVGVVKDMARQRGIGR